MEKIVRIFDSFEEADRADALADARLTPQERLRIVEEYENRLTPASLNKDCREFVALLTSHQVEILNRP